MNRMQPPGGMVFGGFRLTPAVKILLIANVVVFILQYITNNMITAGSGVYGGMVDNLCVFVPELAIKNLQIWRFFTYMFLHGSFTHILFNMFALWMFGTQVEALWGQRTFFIYYFVCGLGGAVLYGIFNLAESSSGAMIGASGAVFGILLAYGMSFPNRVILLMLVIPIKAKYLVILYGLVEFFSIGGSSSGIAHLAHLGGYVAGFIFIKATVPAMGPNVSGGGLGDIKNDISGAWRRFQTKRKMRVVHPDKKVNQSRPGNGSGTGPRKTAAKTQVDEILDKISRNGLQSLTDEEQEILRRAGRK